MLQAVYGCYAAVQLADAAALHQLAAKLPFFFKHRSWQKGAFQVSVTTQCHTIASTQCYKRTKRLFCQAGIAVGHVLLEAYCSGLQGERD